MREVIKRRVAFAAAVILMLSCTAKTSADGGTVHRQSIDVYAKSVYTMADGCYGAEDDGGNYTVKLPDNTEIKVKPKSHDSTYRLVIHPITEQDAQAYAWLSNRVANFGKGILFYDIYFVDEYGKRADIDTESDVSITLPENCKTLKIVSVSEEGNVLRLNSTVGKDRLFFTIDKCGYYAVASETGNYKNSPKTGYTEDSDFWVIIPILIGICCIFPKIPFRRKI